MPYRRFSAKSPPAKPATLPLTCRFTLASSSPLQGIATPAPRREPCSRTGPHRPYEGSQPAHPRSRCRTSAVLIAPTRDRNVRRTANVAVISSPHRPYEGSQPDGGVPVGNRGAGSSSPLRGIATRSSARRCPATCPSSSPLRGIATATAAGCTRGLRRSSSPLRGIATRAARRGPGRPPGVLIAPTRDRNTVTTCGWPTPAGPHRPYQGSQLRAWVPPRGRAAGSSSPLPGIATATAAPLPPPERVLIASTKDRNAVSRSRIRCFWACPHRPYEGSQHDSPHVGHDSRPHVLIAPTRDRNRCPPSPSRSDPGSSSPLRGSQLGVQRGGCTGRCRVLIAPTRDRNWALIRARYRSRLCPYRPYEGSQWHHALGCPQTSPVLTSPHQSSSPLRGIAARYRLPGRWTSPRPHRLTRDRNLSGCKSTTNPYWSSSPLPGITTRPAE